MRSVSWAPLLHWRLPVDVDLYVERVRDVGPVVGAVALSLAALGAGAPAGGALRRVRAVAPLAVAKLGAGGVRDVPREQSRVAALRGGMRRSPRMSTARVSH